MTASPAPLSLNFASDNTVGASPLVMAALAAANDGAASPYGTDAWSARAAKALAELFEREVAVELMATGTGANALAIAGLTRPWSAVLTHEESHIADDEAGAPEFFTNGAKLVPLPGVGSKLDPGTVAARLARMPSGQARHVQPDVLSITQATESGCVYTMAEVAALAEVIRPRGLKLHMDGARFANAVATLGCTPAEITWKAGVDALSFGFTKNGAWAAEAVVYFDPAAARELPWRRKRSGHTLSKGRFLGAQIEALLKDGHWLDLARTANARAARLAAGLANVKGVRLTWPVEANAVFPILPEAVAARLKAAGAAFNPWSDAALPPGTLLGDGEAIYRFVCSFATTEAAVERIVELAQG